MRILVILHILSNHFYVHNFYLCCRSVLYFMCFTVLIRYRPITTPLILCSLLFYVFYLHFILLLSYRPIVLLFYIHPISTARCYAQRGYEIACRLSVCPSVCLSVTFWYCDLIGWNTSKIISRLNSLRSLLTSPPTWAIWSNTHKFGAHTILCVLHTYRVGVHWGVARVCSSVQRAFDAPDCTPWMPTKSSNTRVRSQLCLRVLFIVAIRQRWRWIMMTPVIESIIEKIELKNIDRSTLNITIPATIYR